MLTKIRNSISVLESELKYRVKLSEHEKNLPVLEKSDRQILDTLKKEGAYITTLAELGLPFTPELLQAAYSQLSKMEKVNYGNLSKNLPQIYTVTDLPEIFNWGNNQRLLNIVENYIGLPVAFHGVHLRKDFPNEHQFDTLLWHKDSEDRRMLKVIIYLNDVEKEHGPFEYIPLSSTSLPKLNGYLLDQKLKQSGYLGINDEQLKEIIPESSWISCLGVAGTVVIADTRTALHHGTIRTKERAALFFCYTANPPKRPELCTQYWDNSFARPVLTSHIINS